jgi:hypothetical protein
MTTEKLENTEIETGGENFISVVDGELLNEQVRFPDEAETVVPLTAASPQSEKSDSTKIRIPAAKEEKRRIDQKAFLLYLVAPAIFLTVTLLGGLRFADPDNSFLFLKPALICLIFAAILLVLFFRAGLIWFEGWFSEDFTLLKNTANGAVLLTLFTASVQVFNSLLPESGLPFLVVAFCFFWTLWNNIFAEFEVRKLLKSLGAMFGLAFVVKYLILANLTAPTAESWWQGIIQNTTKEVFTYLLDLPRFSHATGYAQFFTLIFYLFGLFLIAPTTKK